MSFSIWDEENKIHLYGMRAFEYLKVAPDKYVKERLDSAISWDGHLEMEASGPIDCSEEIAILEAELKFRKIGVREEEKTYYVYAEEDCMVTKQTTYEVNALSSEAAKSKVFNNDASVEIISSRNINERNFKYINKKDWKIRQVQQIIN